jgi:hypothetical protein
MVSFAELHALNPYRHLLADLRPLFNPGDAQRVRDVFEWTHCRESVEIARAALAAVTPAFEAERAEHERQIAIHHHAFIAHRDTLEAGSLPRSAPSASRPPAATMRAIAQKHIDQHTDALAAMNLDKRLLSAQKCVDRAEAKLQEAAGELDACLKPPLTMIDVLPVRYHELPVGVG